MTRTVAYLVMVLAAIGLFASFVLHTANFYAGPEFGKREIFIVFPGIFIVWVPTIFLANKLTRDLKQRDFCWQDLGWKVAVESQTGLGLAL